MNLNRRTFVGMSLAAAAATRVMAKAPKPTIDPLKAPRDRFFIAALTPLDSRGNFENSANDEMLAHWKESGADGVLLLGTTGEGQSFSIAERKRILESAARNKHGLDFIVGTGTANIGDTIELSQHAADNGADSVLIVPPFYEKNPPPEGVIAYFDEVFAQVKTPVRYYHIPRVTGVPVPASVFHALTKYPNFVGVKDSNGDAAEYDRIVAAAPGRAILTGTDNLLELALDHGNGCILASGNIYTKFIAEVFRAHRAGQDIKPALARLDGAKNAYSTAIGASAAHIARGVGASKYALSMLLGLNCANVRAPAMPVADAAKPQIRAAIGQLKTYA